MHERDVAATLARDAKALADLADEDIILLQPGASPIVGVNAFRAHLAETFARTTETTIVKYVPEFKDISVSGDLAYEWGYFEVSVTAGGAGETANFRARFLRILKRQKDGTWKFHRVMWTPDNF